MKEQPVNRGNLLRALTDMLECDAQWLGYQFHALSWSYLGHRFNSLPMQLWTGYGWLERVGLADEGELTSDGYALAQLVESELKRKSLLESTRCNAQPGYSQPQNKRGLFDASDKVRMALQAVQASLANS